MTLPKQPEARQLRLLIVDSSEQCRRKLRMGFDADRRIVVVGSATDADMAFSKAGLHRPDCILIGPGLDDVTAHGIRLALMSGGITVPVLEYRKLCPNADMTCDTFDESVIERVIGESGVTAVGRRESLRARSRRIEALLIGSSTGGPQALSAVLSGIPADFPVPIAIVQHMPADITTVFARRLNQTCALEVIEAPHDDVLRAGTVYIAPGGRQMRLRQDGGLVRIGIANDPPVNFCAPSVDVMLLSAAPVYGPRCLVMILTGMGNDGMEGAKACHAQGAEVLVQDEDSSVVWGMPGEVAKSGVATEILPLEELSGAVLSRIGNRLPVGQRATG